MWTEQGALTVVTKIKPDKIDQLRALFVKIVQDDVEDNNIIPFKKLARIHFARWSIMDEALGSPIPPRLIFSTNYDAPLDDHLEELVQIAGPGLDQIYNCCEGYPGQGGRVKYLKAHRVNYSAFFVAAPGLSVKQIDKEANLRDAIEGYIDRNVANPNWVGDVAPPHILADIRDFVKGESDLEWALAPPSQPGFSWKLKYYGRLFLILSFGLILALLLLITFPIWGTILRLKEKTDQQTPNTRYDERATYFATREDQVVQNQMSNISLTKSGPFRRIVLWLVLKAVEVGARYFFTNGILGGVTTIHFARWVIIDRGKSLIFFSNYGSSWESYLGDFIDKAAVGLTAIWSNTRFYPISRWLIQEGAKDEQRFKVWAREQQIVTDVWYTAYKTLSVRNIINNSEIRMGLSRKMDLADTQNWLRRF